MNEKKAALFIGIILTIYLVFGLFVIKTQLDITRQISGSVSKQVTGKYLSMPITFGVCLNTPPQIINITCPKQINENSPLNCAVIANETDNNQILTYAIQFLTPTNVFTINQSTGQINKTLLNSLDLGNHTFNITLIDSSTCSNNYARTNFSFEVISMGNHPPVLISIIPNQTMTQGTSYTAFNLNMYFEDPDNDPITFSSSANSNIVVSLNGASVTFTPNPSFYGTEYFYFYARDPLNASATSNLVKVIVEKKEEEPPKSGGSNVNSGGSATPTNAVPLKCMPEWVCGNWSECFPESIQYRECEDKKSCNITLFKPKTTQNCVYIPTCHDKIKNGNEEEIDCGGACEKRCQQNETCFDGVKNQNEEGLDCGGVCEKSCGETQTCFDGVKNQNEQGIDCGGVCEKKCLEEQQPEKITDYKQYLWILLLILLIIITIYVFKNRKKIKKFIKKLRLKLKMKAKITESEKTIFLNKLNALEAALLKQKTDNSLVKLNEIIGEYIGTLFGEEKSLTNEEIMSKIELLNLETELKEIIINFLDDINKILFSKIETTPNQIKTMIFETRYLILQTTEQATNQRYENLIRLPKHKEEDEAYRLITETYLNQINKETEKAKTTYLSAYQLLVKIGSKDPYAINSLNRSRKTFNEQTKK